MLALALGPSGCAGSSSAGAQDAGSASSGTGPGAAASGRHLYAEALAGLGLSDTQKSQIRGIMTAVHEQNANADPATRRTNMRAAFAKIDTVLTEDQRTKLHAKLAELRKEREAGASPQS
jgi:Spy/CpxP family protein refolding chaperone